MPLHIFEPRYRRMIDRCLEHDAPFGIVHHDPDRSGPFLGEAGRVGTVAAIERHRPLSDGRSVVLVRGAERFAIAREAPPTESYFEARVEPYPDRPPEDRKDLVERRRRSLALFRAVVEEETGGSDPGWSPRNEVSFRLAGTLEVPARWQQALLELRDERRRLERLDAIFRAALEAE